MRKAGLVVCCLLLTAVFAPTGGASAAQATVQAVDMRWTQPDLPAPPQGTARGRSVVGWRLGAAVGGYDIRGGGFSGASTGVGGSVSLDLLARSGWGIGLGVHGSFQDPLDQSFLLNTYQASIRYANIGRGEHYYQYISLDGVAGFYRWNRASTAVGVDTTAYGLGIGPSIGVGGFVGGDGIAMEISIGYAFMWFRDRKTPAGTLAGTSVQTNILRLLVGVWIG